MQNRKIIKDVVRSIRHLYRSIATAAYDDVLFRASPYGHGANVVFMAYLLNMNMNMNMNSHSGSLQKGIYLFCRI